MPKPVVNVNVDDDTPLYPNELLLYAPISCPCPASSTDEASKAESEDLETIINRNEMDTFSSNSDSKSIDTDRSERIFSLFIDSAGLLKSLSSEDNLGMDNLPSSMSSFPLTFDNQIETFLQQWTTDLDDLVLQPTLNQQATSIVDAPIPSKIRLAGLFDIPLPELKFQPSAMKEANRFAEQQLNRTYAIELNPNEKLGDFRLRVPDMAIDVPVHVHSHRQ